MEEKNIFNYGYEEGTKLSIDGNLIVGFMDFLNNVAAQETKPMFKLGEVNTETGERTEAQAKVVEFYLTDLGRQASLLLQPLIEAHQKAIEQGIAKDMTQKGIITDAKPNK